MHSQYYMVKRGAIEAELTRCLLARVIATILQNSLSPKQNQHMVLGELAIQPALFFEESDFSLSGHEDHDLILGRRHSQIHYYEPN